MQICNEFMQVEGRFATSLVVPRKSPYRDERCVLHFLLQSIHIVSFRSLLFTVNLNHWDSQRSTSPYRIRIEPDSSDTCPGRVGHVSATCLVSTRSLEVSVRQAGREAGTGEVNFDEKRGPTDLGVTAAGKARAARAAWRARPSGWPWPRLGGRRCAWRSRDVPRTQLERQEGAKRG